MTSVQRYVHHPLGEPVEAIGGSYVLVKEVRLPHPRGEVLYVVGHAVFDTTCCGFGGCGYAQVQGLVRSWHDHQSDDGLAVSLVEPMDHDGDRDALRREILAREAVQQVTFR